MASISDNTKRVYMDYAASTPVAPEVLAVMEPYFRSTFANPFSLHQEGRIARQALEEARERIAKILSVQPETVVFTSGATESNALAIKGCVTHILRTSAGKSTAHMLTTEIEHDSVLGVYDELRRAGVSYDCIPIDREGRVVVKQLRSVLKSTTRFVSVHTANSEIGVLQPVDTLAQELKRQQADALFHTDASQAPLWVPTDTLNEHIDLVTLDSHKIYGPKGVGALVIRNARMCESLFGGAKALRPGTPNVAGVVGFAKAFELAHERAERDAKRISTLRDYAIGEIRSRLPGSIVNGSRTHRLANNVNVSFPGQHAEFLVTQLDARGIACASRSACLGGEKEGSYVVLALDPSDDARAKGAVRFSFGRETTKNDIEYMLDALTEVVL